MSNDRRAIIRRAGRRAMNSAHVDQAFETTKANAAKYARRAGAAGSTRRLGKEAAQVIGED